ncbi:hypothetical protein RRSWK_02291 [Rhodopirellula sp. SWK7]|nr:hypothetical protein RRSWK_02291 [Rhodopirellula sp. SWK7]
MGGFICAHLARENANGSRQQGDVRDEKDLCITSRYTNLRFGHSG